MSSKGSGRFDYTGQKEVSKPTFKELLFSLLSRLELNKIV